MNMDVRLSGLDGNNLQHHQAGSYTYDPEI